MSLRPFPGIGAATAPSCSWPCTAPRAPDAQRLRDAGRHSGYSYAGHQATDRGRGIRATLTLTRPPRSQRATSRAGSASAGPARARTAATPGSRRGRDRAGDGDDGLRRGHARGPLPGSCSCGSGSGWAAATHRRARDRAGRTGWWRVGRRPARDRAGAHPRLVGRWTPIATAEAGTAARPRATPSRTGSRRLRRARRGRRLADVRPGPPLPGQRVPAPPHRLGSRGRPPVLLPRLALVSWLRRSRPRTKPSS